jgi:hypothetical protein
MLMWGMGFGLEVGFAQQPQPPSPQQPPLKKKQKGKRDLDLPAIYKYLPIKHYNGAPLIRLRA